MRKSSRVFFLQMLFLVVAAAAAWLLLRLEAPPHLVVWLLVSVAAASFIGEAIYRVSRRLTEHADPDA